MRQFDELFLNLFIVHIFCHLFDDFLGFFDKWFSLK